MSYCSEEPTEALNLVSSSLRQRAIWAPATMQLLRSDGGRWREANLDTQDLELSVPDAQLERYEAFRLILLSPGDVDETRTVDRIQQLYHLGGDRHRRNAGIVLLLDHDWPQGAMQPFMELHIQMASNNCMMPLIPLTSPDALPVALESFRSSLAASRAAGIAPADATRDLLPYCAIERPLSGRAVDTLSMGSLGFRELLSELATEKGRGRILSALEPAEAESLVSFWTHEFATA